MEVPFYYHQGEAFPNFDGDPEIGNLQNDFASIEEFFLPRTALLAVMNPSGL